MNHMEPPANAEARQQSPSLLYNAAHSLVANSISVLLSIVSSIVIARWLGPEAKGSADLISATANMLAAIFGVSLSSGVIYIVARDRFVSHRLLPQLILTSLVQTGIATCSLAVLLATPLAPALTPPGSESWSIPLTAALVGLLLIAGQLRGIAAGLQQFPPLNVANLAGQAVIIGLIALTIIAPLYGGPRLSPFLLICYQILGITATMGILFWSLRPAFLHQSQYAHRLGEVVAYAIPQHGANIAQYLSYRLDIFFVGYFAGMRGVGLYTLAVNIAQLLWLISGAISQALLPNVAATDDPVAARQRTARLSRITLWLNGVLALILALASEIAFPLVFGAAFAESVTAMIWLLPGIVIFSVANMTRSYLLGMGKPRLSLWAALVNLAVMLILDIALIPGLGIVGASIASTISYTAATVVMIALFMRETGMPAVSLLLPTRDDAMLVGALARRVIRAGIGRRQGA